MRKLKIILFAGFAVVSSSLVHAGEFLTDFEAGKKEAAQGKKSLLVKFTGSDWCPPCKQLQANVFSKDKFKTEVEKDFVVVVLDFPRTKKLPEAEAKANRALAEEYSVRGFPAVILMDAEGKAFKTFAGYDGSDVEDYLANLKKALKAKSFQ